MDEVRQRTCRGVQGALAVALLALGACNDGGDKDDGGETDPPDTDVPDTDTEVPGETGDTGDTEVPVGPEAWIQVSCQPPPTGCLEQTYTAEASTGEGLTYTWDFGDGVDVAAAQVVRTIPDPMQAVEARLTVTDLAGLTSTTTVIVEPPAESVVTNPDIFQFSRSVTQFKDGTCQVSHAVIDYLDSTGNLEVGGCFLGFERFDLLADHPVSPVGPFRDIVFFDLAATVIADQATITVANPPATGSQRTWYVRWNFDGMGADDFEPNPPPMANPPAPLYPATAPYPNMTWPPAHLSVWHLVDPGTTYAPMWRRVDIDTKTSENHGSLATVTCPAVGSGEERMAYDPRDPTAVDTDADGYTFDVDCDDFDDTIYPGAVDEPYDGVDADCAGDDDFDADGDGVVSDAHGGTDCDDTNADVAPGLTELYYNDLDDDCEPTTLDDDQDGDGYVAESEGGDDCDDTEAGVNPGASEDAARDNGLDDDCNGVVDDLCTTLATAPDRSVPADHATVADAVAAASAGETVCLEPGTWVGSVDLGSTPITLVGAGGPEVTTLLGGPTDPVLTVGPGMTGGRITGLSVVGGADGGVVVLASSVQLDDLDIGDHAGTGLEMNSSGAVVSDVTVRDSVGVGDNAGGVVVEGGEPSFTDVVIRDNVGGGLELRGVTGGTFEGLQITGNPRSSGAGGGVRVWQGSDVTLTDLTVQGNSAPDGGGVSVEGDATASLIDLVVDGNSATSGQGGGVYISAPGSTVVWTGGQLVRNLAAGDGGGASVEVAGLTMTGVVVADNSTDAQVGGVKLLSYGESEVRLNTFVGNQAPDGAAGLGVVTGQSNGTYVVSENVFTHHTGPSAAPAVALVGNPFSVTLSITSNLFHANASDGVSLPGGSDTSGNADLSPGYVLFHPQLDSTLWDLRGLPGSALRDFTGFNGLVPEVGAYGAATADASYYADDDGDGMWDGWETHHGLDPTTDDTAADADADGVDNGSEFGVSLPDKTDTDGDGAEDAFDTEPANPTVQ